MLCLCMLCYDTLNYVVLRYVMLRYVMVYVYTYKRYMEQNDIYLYKSFVHIMYQPPTDESQKKMNRIAPIVTFAKGSRKLV